MLHKKQAMDFALRKNNTKRVIWRNVVTKRPTLKEMGIQYIAEADKLRARAKEVRAQADAAEEAECRELMRRVDSLYASARDARSVGVYLMGYYGDKN